MAVINLFLITEHADCSRTQNGLNSCVSETLHTYFTYEVLFNYFQTKLTKCRPIAEHLK